MKINDFRYWCHKVLPLVYDESLSYYEVLCKLTHYVNTIIESIDDTNAEIEELKALFVQLKDYVDHYFDTLDISSEVDAKLDEMAEDGTLASTLASYFNMYITPEAYGAKGDGVTDDTSAIQQAINTGKDVLFSKATYLVSKASNSTLFPNHDEPCLYLYNKRNQTINGNGAKLKVNAHGQGVLEIINSLFITVKDLEIEGYGSFPKLDTNSGRAEKGSTGEGYYDTEHAYQFSLYKNNSVDTSNYHGFGNDAQEVWGTFGNGYIGNCGCGILIYNGCNKVTVDNCKIHGFNYAGIQVGSRTQETQISNYNITLTNNLIYTCYNAGISMEGGNYYSNISGNYIYNIGHPDAFPSEDSTYEYTYADPGYAITCTVAGETIPDSITITNNIIRRVIRKGIDAHSSHSIIISNNNIRLAYAYAIQCEELSVGGLLRNVIIDNNIIFGGCNKGGVINVVCAKEIKEYRYLNISNNQCSGVDLDDVGAFIFVRYISAVNISNNNMTGINAVDGIVCIASDDANINGNKIRGSVNRYPLQLYGNISSLCENNIFDTLGNSYAYSVEYCTPIIFKDNLFKSASGDTVLSNSNGLTVNNLIYDRNDTLIKGNSLYEYSNLNAISITTTGDTYTPDHDCVITISTNPTSGSESYLTVQGNDSVGCVFSGYSEQGTRIGGNAFLRAGVTYTFTFSNVGTPGIKYFTVVNSQ